MNSLDQKLRERKEKGTFRALLSFEGMIDFVSNDYLGLAQCTTGEQHFGSTGSRLISGNCRAMEELEARLGSFFHAPSGLFFNSGYLANLAIFSCIPQRGEIVLYDEQIHASVRDGLRLGQAKSYKFEHNALVDLERLLIKFRGQTIYVATEALFSMRGDLAPLPEMAGLCKRYQAKMIVDEAHSAGVFGAHGEGLVSASGLDDQVFIKLMTFGKAFGSHGALVCTVPLVRDYLINFARPFIYTTAPSLGALQRIEGLIVTGNLIERMDALHNNIRKFRTQNGDLNLSSDPASPIQIIHASLADLNEIASDLEHNKIAAKVILPPTVKAGEECLRICIHSFNTEAELERMHRVLHR